MTNSTFIKAVFSEVYELGLKAEDKQDKRLARGAILNSQFLMLNELGAPIVNRLGVNV